MAGEKEDHQAVQLVLHVDARACTPATAAPLLPAGPHSDELAPVAEQVESSEPGISFDDALTKYVGEFGKGQALVYLWACLLQVPNAVLILLLVFTLGDPVASKAWTCTAPQPAAAAPHNATAAAACWAVHDAPSPAAAGFCSLPREDWAWQETRRRGLVSEFDLVCGSAWRAQVANSFFFLGYLIGSGVCGVAADAFGRKRVTFAASALAGSATAIALAASNFWVLLALRLVTGVGVAGQALGSYLLATEMLGPAWRGVMGILLQCFFILGEFVLVVFAVSLTSGWRAQFAAAAVLCGASLLLWPLLPESGRWLHVQGRSEEALQVLTQLARANGSQPPAEPLLRVGQASHQQQQLATSLGGSKPAAEAVPAGATVIITADACCSSPRPHAPAPPQQQQQQPKLSLWAAMRNRHIARRFLILSYSWLVMCLAYYGISFALGGLGGSLITSFSLAALAELPSYLLAAWAIENIGRHNTMAAGMLLGGGACIACGLVPVRVAQAALAAVGKFGIAASFGVASIYTSELFPTLIRSAVLGYANQAARLGGIIAPFIVMAGTATGGSAARLVPFLTFGVASVVAGLLIFTLPETLGVPLPDTLQDMDNIASVFTHKTWKGPGGLKAAGRSMFKTRVAGGRANNNQRPEQRQPHQQHERAP